MLNSKSDCLSIVNRFDIFYNRIFSSIAAMLVLSVSGLANPAFAQVPPEDLSQGDGRVSAFYSLYGQIPKEPGRLLSVEPLPLTLGLANAAYQARILYTSTNGATGTGTVAVSGAVFVPKGQAPQGGWPIIAWAHGTVGVADICAPSWAGRSYRDVQYLNTWLAQGYAIVATDYQGLGTPGPHLYQQTRPAAYSVLDSVRAMLSVPVGFANKVVVVGQSQGGGVAFATTGLAPTYAPDVNLLGTVATGMPNLTLRGFAAPPTTDPNVVDPPLAYTYYLILMAQQLQPQLDAAQVFTPLALPIFEQARTSCVAALEADVTLLGLTDATTLVPGGVARALTPIAQTITYPTLKFETPLFTGTGGKDIDVPTAGQLALIADTCAAGSVVEQHFYPDQDHNSTLNTSLADSIPFVRKVLSGERVYSTCRSLP